MRGVLSFCLSQNSFYILFKLIHTHTCIYSIVLYSLIHYTILLYIVLLIYVQLALYVLYIFFCHSSHVFSDLCANNNINQPVYMVTIAIGGEYVLKIENVEKALGNIRQCILTWYILTGIMCNLSKSPSKPY